MKTFEFNSVEESYQGLISALLNEGTRVAPRGLGTLELTPVAVTINDPRRNVISNKCRRLNYGFMNAELSWIMSGSNETWITHYNKNWMSFSDDGLTLNGAYGDRVFKYRGPSVLVDQFTSAYELLRDDPDSRQATIVLFNPELDYRQTKDKPCTNLMRFKIRDGKLQMIVFMRSNDVMLGYPYDVFNFTSMQAIMASMLGVELGTYTHIVDSFHIYENDVDWAKDIVAEPFQTIYDASPLSNVNQGVLTAVQAVVNVEASTRKLSDVLEVSTVTKILDDIADDYWCSSAAMLALYNFRKARRPQADLDVLAKYVKSEFNVFLDRYRSLAN